MENEKEVRIGTPAGIAVGYREESGLTRFRYLPFATAGRFQKPEQIKVWTKPEGAKEYGPAPIQPPPSPFWAARSGEPVDFPQSEECLHLNIWSMESEQPKKAVLFWVYGGSYIQGYNYKKGYLPENFVKAHPDILVVAPNYRVGVLGSLNLSAVTQAPEYCYSNNLALLDLLAALHWTKENIASFGGDPEKITLYGHSAGSNAITHLLVSPLAKELFQQAICQSSYMSDLGTVAVDTSVEIAAKFFEVMNISTLEELLALTPEQLLEGQKALFGFSYGGRASKMFSPVEDGITVMPNAFQCYTRGEINAKALMIGGSEGEYDQMFLQKNLEETKAFVIQKNADKKVTEADVEEFIGMHPEMTDKEACMTIHNDLGLRLGGEFIGQSCAEYIPVYEYVFRLRDPENGWRALHGAPSNYVFGTVIPEGAPEHMEEQMMNTWAAFINTGDPNNDSIPAWPLYYPNGPVMCMDKEWSVNAEYWKKDFNYWGPRFREYQLLKH